MIPRLLIPLLLAGALAPTLLANGIFTTSGREILKDGVEFEVKGICYQPAAIGENPSTGYPFGDYYYTDANTSGADEQYPARWERDFENFDKLGVNVDVAASAKATLDRGRDFRLVKQDSFDSHDIDVAAVGYRGLRADTAAGHLQPLTCIN